jgi:hypothetical protein
MLSVAMLSHGADAPFPPGVFVAHDQHDSCFHDALPEKLGRLVDEDHVDSPAGNEIGEGNGNPGLKPSARTVISHRKNRNVEIAVLTRLARGSRTE